MKEGDEMKWIEIVGDGIEIEIEERRVWCIKWLY